METFSNHCSLWNTKTVLRQFILNEKRKKPEEPSLINSNIRKLFHRTTYGRNYQFNNHLIPKLSQLTSFITFWFDLLLVSFGWTSSGQTRWPLSGGIGLSWEGFRFGEIYWWMTWHRFLEEVEQVYLVDFEANANVFLLKNLTKKIANNSFRSETKQNFRFESFFDFQPNFFVFNYI